MPLCLLNPQLLASLALYFVTESAQDEVELCFFSCTLSTRLELEIRDRQQHEQEHGVEIKTVLLARLKMMCLLSSMHSGKF